MVVDGFPSLAPIVTPSVLDVGEPTVGADGVLANVQKSSSEPSVVLIEFVAYALK